VRVVQIGPFPPPHGGVQTNLVAIRDFLRQQRIPCAVINLTRFRRPDGDGVYYPKNAAQLLWRLLRLRCDIIHLHFGGDLNPRLLGLALVCSVLPGARVVLTFHSGGYPSSPAGKSAGPRTLRGYIFRRLDRVIAVNPELVELFGRFGVDPRRTRLIHPHAPSGPAADGSLPEPLAGFFAAHRPVLLTVGLLEPEYDLPLQIEALSAVRRSHPDAGLVIIGAGSLEDDLRRLIQTRADRNHILLCGDVPHPATLQAIAKATVLLRTTLYDGDAISVREALHLGTPVIASDNGMRPEGVRLIPRGDLAELSRAIERCLAADSGGRERLGPGEANDENLQAVLRLYRELSG
jgi:glycogen(starch) synthase